MKKLLLSALAVCAFSFSNAQEKITFGAKAGLNLATLTGDVENADMKAGIHFGGMAEISINDKFSVQPELLFSTQGAKYEDSYNDGFETGKIEGKEKLTYINLPIIAKYYVTEGLSLEAGPQIGFLVSAEQEYDATYREISSGLEYSDSGENDIEDTNAIDFGLNFGLGYKLDSGLNFSARYNLAGTLSWFGGIIALVQANTGSHKSTRNQPDPGWHFCNPHPPTSHLLFLVALGG
jgi:hypothetical protein